MHCAHIEYQCTVHVQTIKLFSGKQWFWWKKTHFQCIQLENRAMVLRKHEMKAIKTWKKEKAIIIRVCYYEILSACVCLCVVQEKCISCNNVSYISTVLRHSVRAIMRSLLTVSAHLYDQRSHFYLYFFCFLIFNLYVQFSLTPFSSMWFCSEKQFLRRQTASINVRCWWCCDNQWRMCELVLWIQKDVSVLACKQCARQSDADAK